jgi:two-component sensor histidine kinase
MHDNSPSGAGQARLISGVLRGLARARSREEALSSVVLSAQQACEADGVTFRSRGSPALHGSVADEDPVRVEAIRALMSRACFEVLEREVPLISHYSADRYAPMADPCDLVTLRVGEGEDAAAVCFYWLKPRPPPLDESALLDAIARACHLALRAPPVQPIQVSDAYLRTETRRFDEFRRQVHGLFAIIRSIVRRTARSGASLDDYVSNLEDRLTTLTRIHGYVLRVPDSGVDLEELVWGELLAQALDADDATVQGLPVRLSTKAAEALGLAIHELVVNSQTFGSLSEAAGTLRIAWAPDTTQPGWTCLQWQEIGSKHASQLSSARGFGLGLIERILPYELGAQTSFGVGPAGFQCAISFPPDSVGRKTPCP